MSGRWVSSAGFSGMFPRPMKLRSPTSTSRSAWMLCGALALTQCSSNAPPRPNPQDQTVVVTTAPGVAQAIDLSPVPVPEQVVVTIRVASLNGAARRVGQLTGLNNVGTEAVQAAVSDMLHDEALVRVVDLDGAVDLAVYTRGDDDAGGMLSFAAVPLARAEALLGEGHTLEAYGDPSWGVRRVVRSDTQAQTENPPQRDLILLAPAGGSAGAARLVVVDRGSDQAQQVTRYLPYLTRTLAATPLQPGAGDLVVEANAPNVRAQLGGPVRRGIDHWVDDLVPGPDPNNAQFRDSVRSWLREVMQSLPQTLEELDAARASVTLGERGATLSIDAGVRNPTAPYLQQFLTAVRDHHPPADLLARLPVGGSAYGAMSASLEPFRTSLNIASSAVARTLVPRTRFPIEADANALRTALSALFAQDRVSTAATGGRDPQGRPWQVALFQVTTPAPQFVANVRALVTALKRPGVARAFTADHHMNPMTWLLAPTVGLPPGSLLVRIPGPLGTAAARPGVPAARPAATAANRRWPMEVLLVPDGANVWCVVAGDAKARWQSAQGTHPSVTLPGIDAPGVVGIGGVFPLIVADAFADEDDRFASMVRETVQRGGAEANAATVMRAGTTLRDGVQHFTFDLEVPRGVLGLLGAAMRGP